MRVLWLSNTPANADDFLGADTYSGGWLKWLNRELEQYVDLHVAFFNPKGPDVFKVGKTTYYSLGSKNWKVKLALKSFLGIGFRRINIDFCLELIDLIQPELIHIHGTENEYLELVKYTKVPVLVSIQGIATVISHKFNSGFSYKILATTFRGGGRINSFLPKSLQSDEDLLSSMAVAEGKFLPHVSFIAGRTGWDHYVTRILAPNSKYFKIDEILKEQFYHHTWEEPGIGNQFVIYTTASPAAYKGIETICQALFELQKVIDSVIWIVGGVAETDPIIRSVRRALGKQFPVKGLILAGKLTPDEIIANMNRSHLYVMASHIENSPNNLAEAMIMGMPIIATFAGGTGDFVNNNVNGLLVQSGDPWAIAGSILHLKNDLAKAERLGKNARLDALVRHNKDRITGQVLDCYKKINNIVKNEQ